MEAEGNAQRLKTQKPNEKGTPLMGSTGTEKVALMGEGSRVEGCALRGR